MLEFESAIIFCIALIFTLLFIEEKEVVYGIFAMGCWWILSLLWLINPAPSSAISIAFFFQAIGFFCMILVFILIFQDLIRRKKTGGREPSELDEW